ncbi:retrotransposon protein, putative, unclassified [Cucumis melo var. makuwa]|uniref:Retrotransposon protein, putative, unclassified n=1 Tax=Cucumis melo var. makuwa TaxID=1194695 RepID=A0A5D3CLH4_CUCMM|nr:retrotransposon protein, putative, unclassified [Cucumis melo var. makuwa]
MSGELHWKGMKKDVNKYVEQCDICQHNKTEATRPTAKQVAKVFIDKVVQKHGNPKSIITDRDKIILSNFWKELFANMGTILKRTTTFHPQTDGQTERVNRTKKMADLKRRELRFKVGDKVYLKLRPYRQCSLATKRCGKLAPKFYGPYKIIEEVGEVTNRLQLPPEAIIHNVFHVSQLKLKLGKQHQVQHEAPILTGEFELQL